MLAARGGSTQGGGGSSAGGSAARSHGRAQPCPVFLPHSVSQHAVAAACRCRMGEELGRGAFGQVRWCGRRRKDWLHSCGGVLL